MTLHTLSGGFTDPAIDSARAFRAILDAMAHPGRIVRLTGATAPAPASAALATALAALADPTTPVHLAGRHDTPDLRQWLAFHTGAPTGPRRGATFAAGDWAALLPLADYDAGLPEYPVRSATLIAEVPHLAPQGARLTGPGIATEAFLSLPDLDALRWNAARFPLGLDLLFTCGDRLAALPRTTKVGGA